MAKIFDVQDWLKNHPNRNNFDLTHKVHGSYQFGKLYPILCKPVVPTDSFRIDTAVSLRFTPMPFPTQSNMRVIFHYFYVRTKNIWKNFPNWLQGLEEHTPPYIDQSASFYADGSLADHLDVPTSYLSPNSFIDSSFNTAFLDYNDDYRYYSSVFTGTFSTYKLPFVEQSVLSVYLPAFEPIPVHSYNFNLSTDASASTEIYLPFFVGKFYSIFSSSVFLSLPVKSVPRKLFFNLNSRVSSEFSYNSLSNFYVLFSKSPFTPGTEFKNLVGYSVYNYLGDLQSTSFDDSVKDDFTSLQSEGLFSVVLISCKCDTDVSGSSPSSYPFSIDGFKYSIFSPAHHVNVADVTSPYASTGDTTGKIKVSALPFRAYESIYNAFYRNSQGVQPFQIDGTTQYNKYVTTDDDGADTTNYALYERNWELDAYTSCLISPQQGNVPYVGITEVSALGRMHIETPEGDRAEVQLTDNGDGVEISNLHGDSPEARSYALRAASSGFTIPEFRETNALQRFLEMNIRKGYKYIDFIEGHFGKKPTYAEMDMPEFIGGFSQRIQVNEISNTNGVDNDTLGAIAGQARAIGGSKHGVNHYFDDFGFVVGIMCIVPDNAYDSILPKHFNLKNPLDMYFPEFSQLSYMPLTHEELAPIQTINDARGSAYQDLTKVFGYQRPNHDLVWYPDTVHGLFRDASGIGNSVICRRFAQRPELSDAFLRIKPEETDTIFNYTFGDNDIALGEIVLNISAKRPVPRLVVPTIS